MVLVNVKFNLFRIIYIEMFKNNNVIKERLDILTFQFHQLEF